MDDIPDLWSEWEWSSEHQQYYCRRQNKAGEWETRWAFSLETPPVGSLDRATSTVQHQSSAAVDTNDRSNIVNAEQDNDPGYSNEGVKRFEQLISSYYGPNARSSEHDAAGSHYVTPHMTPGSWHRGYNESMEIDGYELLYQQEHEPHEPSNWDDWPSVEDKVAWVEPSEHEIGPQAAVHGSPDITEVGQRISSKPLPYSERQQRLKEVYTYLDRSMNQRAWGAQDTNNDVHLASVSTTQGHGETVYVRKGTRSESGSDKVDNILSGNTAALSTMHLSGEEQIQDVREDPADERQESMLLSLRSTQSEGEELEAISDVLPTMSPAYTTQSATGSENSTGNLMNVDLDWCNAFGRGNNMKITLCQRLTGWSVTKFLTSPEIWRAALHSITHQHGHSRHEGAGPTSTSVAHRAGQPSDSRLHDARKRSLDDQATEGEGSSVRAGKRKCTPEQQAQSRLFACPFFKHSRARYKLCRSCPGPGWQNVHRLKEHIYRKHKLPIHCPRCRHVFGTAPLLLEHQRAITPCVIRDRPFCEGIDSTQERILRSRKQITADEEEKWNIMYRVLFPDDDAITMPTPYYDDPTDGADVAESALVPELDQYEAFVQQELPLIARQEIERIVDEASELDNGFWNLRQQLQSAFQDMQLRLLRLFRQNSQAALATSIGMSFGDPHLSSDIEPPRGVDSGDNAGHTSHPEQNPARVAGATDDFVGAEWL